MAKKPQTVLAFAEHHLKQTAREVTARGVSFHVFDDPSGSSLIVSDGLAAVSPRLNRGKPAGFELTCHVPTSEVPAHVEGLAGAIETQRHARTTGERRPPIEFNGAFAAGYPPHYVFSTDLVPAVLAGNHLIAGRYVEFIAAHPIDDAQLRAYDSGPAAFIRALVAAR